MPAINSSMLSLGTAAPDFALPNVADNATIVRLADFVGQPLLVMFICNHCPYVVHVMAKLAEISNTFQAHGGAVVAISANDVEAYPADAPALMAEFATEYGFQFPYCYDAAQDVARAYDAQCTPDFFLFDGAHKLCYRGQMDGSRPGNAVPVTGEHLSAALHAVLAGESPSAEQFPSLGCSIKWKAAN